MPVQYTVLTRAWSDGNLQNHPFATKFKIKSHKKCSCVYDISPYAAAIEIN